MYTLKLSDSLFADIEVGDIFVYRYSENSYGIQEAEENYQPPLNEFTVEIRCFKSRRHFIFKRKNGA